MNGLRIAQDGRGRDAARLPLLCSVAPEDLHGLGARGETGDLALDGRHPLDGARQRVRLASAGPPP